MNLKGAETGTLILWAKHLFESHGGLVEHREELKIALAGLAGWLEVTRVAGPVFTAAEYQDLRDCCQRHLLYSEMANVHFVPKHHFFAHLTVQSWDKGNPRSYSCFLDESLNQTLRNIAAASHRARQAERIFTHFNLLGFLGWSPNLYGE